MYAKFQHYLHSIILHKSDQNFAKLLNSKQTL